MAIKQGEETDEQKAEREAAEETAFAERVSKVVSPLMNKAITSHLRKAETATNARFDEIKQLLTARKPDGEGDDAGGDGEGAGEGDDAGQRAAGVQGGGRTGEGKFKGKPDPEMVARIRALEASQKAVQKRADDAEKKNAEMEARRRVDEENDLSTKTLLGLGIKDDVQLESALLFHRGKGRILRDPDTGKPLFKRVDKDGDDELVPLETGLKDWGKTDEAKRFLPSTGGGGTGGTGGGSGKNNGAGSGKGVPSDEQFGTTIANLIFGGGQQ